jgi:hypothetical protein
VLAQFTCFTGTKVQILTQQALSRFTCFTGTNSTNADAAEALQAVSRQRRGGALAACFYYSVCLLGWYKSAKTDAAGAAGGLAAHQVRARAY